MATYIVINWLNVISESAWKKICGTKEYCRENRSGGAGGGGGGIDTLHGYRLHIQLAYTQYYNPQEGGGGGILGHSGVGGNKDPPPRNLWMHRENTETTFVSTLVSREAVDVIIYNSSFFLFFFLTHGFLSFKAWVRHR